MVTLWSLLGDKPKSNPCEPTSLNAPTRCVGNMTGAFFFSRCFLSNLHPEPWSFMIQFDLRIFLGWGETTN